MSANIISIESHRDFLSGPALRTRKRVFDLGMHSYLGAPGLSWTTNYCIKRLGKGEYWELYASIEPALSRREHAGTFTPDQLRRYFEDVGFYMDDQDWRDYGLGFTSEVLDFDSSMSSAET
jgi:hypothetical protein